MLHPISSNSLKWVDNVTSVYSIFKSWQNCAQLAQTHGLGGNMEDSMPPPLPRPIDMSYGKIIPALKEKGIRRVISRISNTNPKIKIIVQKKPSFWFEFQKP
ncbi:hypothetical protein RHMOL_Rhmol07G0184800 [Rhododendron molle]|uniref:Uncharacterized protein n=1 Tax=Rhododendron molle TaxID=49168 RepID=A0ACC0N3L1_RHOML|nr:hypothetical protein RHMOL_Rhmol07G0184800 [Rhododendron molle]